MLFLLPCRSHLGERAQTDAAACGRACGPSGLLGEASRKRRRLPQPRLLRVSVPVTLLVPSAYRHRACALQPLSSMKALLFLQALHQNHSRTTWRKVSSIYVIIVSAGTSSISMHALVKAWDGCIGTHNLLGLVQEGVGEVCAVDVSTAQIAPARALSMS